MIDVLYRLPIVLLFALVVGGSAIAAVALVGIAVRLRKPSRQAGSSDVAFVIHQSLIAGYSVLLAFVTVNVWQGYQVAAAAAHSEATALSDIAGVAMTLPAAQRSELLQAVHGYADAALTHEWTDMARGRTPRPHNASVARLNAAVLTVHATDSRELALLQQLVRLHERVLDERRTRLTNAGAAVGGPFWVVLITGGLMCVGSVYFFRVSSAALSLVPGGVLGAMFGLFYFLIVLLDFPFRGPYAVSPDAFVAVLELVRAR